MTTMHQIVGRFCTLVTTSRLFLHIKLQTAKTLNATQKKMVTKQNNTQQVYNYGTGMVIVMGYAYPIIVFCRNSGGGLAL